MLKRILYLIMFVLLLAKVDTYAQTDSIIDTTTFSAPTTDEEDKYNEEDEAEDTSVLRTIPDSKWQKIKNDKAFIYKREKEKKKQESLFKPKPYFDISNFFNSAIFKILLFVLLGIVLVLVIQHFFFNGEFNYFKSRQKKTSQVNHSYEEVEEFTEWEKALKDALASQDYRLAVRILYLETLQNLHTRQLINFQHDKTNWDYVQQMQRHQHGNSFKTLTSYFDYIWYGKFEVSQDQYDMIESLFRTFQQNIK